MRTSTINYSMTIFDSTRMGFVKVASAEDTKGQLLNSSFLILRKLSFDRLGGQGTREQLVWRSGGV